MDVKPRCRVDDAALTLEADAQRFVKIRRVVRVIFAHFKQRLHAHRRDVRRALARGEPLRQSLAEKDDSLRFRGVAFTVFLALRVRSILGTIMTAQAICAGITIIYFMLLYKPTLCKKSSASATMIAAYIVLALWLLFPQTHIMKELIYLEWIVCIIVFFVAGAVDKRPITLPEYGKT